MTPKQRIARARLRLAWAEVRTGTGWPWALGRLVKALWGAWGK